MRRIFPRRPYFNVIGRKRIWFALSSVVIVVSIVALLTRGLNFGIDFTGGTQLDIRCKKGTSLQQVRGVMADFGYADAKIQKSGEDTFIIRTAQLSKEKGAEVVEALKKGAGMEELLQLSDVGPGWGGQVSRQAVIALIIFLVAILIYISFRFEFKMALCAIVALFHDVTITVGVYALTGREVTPATVIAVLTILGYSLYDTIVIFDRVKENTELLTKQSRKTYSQTVNDALNQTLARSLNTSLTTLIPIVTILVFGGETLDAFAFALFVGVIAGTYSSLFVASPLLSLWKETEPKYRAYRERLERQKVRETREKAKPAPAAGGKAPAVGREAQVGGKKAAQRAVKATAAKKAAKPPAGATVKPKGVSGTEPDSAPKPRPKPAAKAPSGARKSSAKSRTKGPGAGKKKKKKK